MKYLYLHSTIRTSIHPSHCSPHATEHDVRLWFQSFPLVRLRTRQQQQQQGDVVSAYPCWPSEAGIQTHPKDIQGLVFQICNVYFEEVVQVLPAAAATTSWNECQHREQRNILQRGCLTCSLVQAEHR